MIYWLNYYVKLLRGDIPKLIPELNRIKKVKF